ncbi:MAG: hypothetical protein NTV04_20425 [Deltaproteobacteria bacterium]|nr:hypothetical protein [Deltaproteobacteria bacterium]
MAKVTKVFMWLSIALGIAAALVPWVFFLFDKIAYPNVSTTETGTLPRGDTHGRISAGTGDDIAKDHEIPEGFALLPDTPAASTSDGNNKGANMLSVPEVPKADGNNELSWDLGPESLPSEPLTGWRSFWAKSAGYVVASAIALPAAGGFPWLIYLILSGVKALVAAVKREQDTRPKLLNVRQRIVVWVVASLLTVASLAHGYKLGEGSYGGFEWSSSGLFKYSSLLWMVIIPILLMGAATFIHVMRRKG